MELEDKLRLVLKETNPWWKNSSFRQKDYVPRQIYSQIEKFFALPQILALVGLRRTGKTTLILKIIENFIPKTGPESILYFSFDDFSSLELEELFLAYKNIFPEIDLKQGRFLFCFDEIQKLKDWQDKLKRIYDLYPNIKIIISGSETLFLRKKIKETLAGRIFEFRVSPLNFREYLDFTGNRRMIKNTRLYAEELVKLYKKFLKTSGFPEVARIEDNMIIHKYLKESVIDKILFRDIPQLFKVRNTGALAEILEIIVFSPGQIIDTVNLSKDLGLSRQAVSSYLDYLEKSFLIKKVYNFSKNLRKQKRALKKYYPAVVYPSLVEDKFAACFENSLIWQMDAQFFYRDAYKNEVDAILVGENKEITAVEVKTGKIELKGVNYFIKKYNVSQAKIITVGKEGVEGNVAMVPFYEYLLK